MSPLSDSVSEAPAAPCDGAFGDPSEFPSTSGRDVPLAELAKLSPNEREAVASHVRRLLDLDAPRRAAILEAVRLMLGGGGR